MNDEIRVFVFTSNVGEKYFFLQHGRGDVCGVFHIDTVHLIFQARYFSDA